MAEGTIIIDGKSVKFRSTAGTPFLYAQKFHRDIMIDVVELGNEQSKAQKEKRVLSTETLKIFYMIAYTMAKDADPEAVPDDPDEWLEGFNIFSIYQILPQILEIWGINTQSMVKAKKKVKGKRNGS